ncbi:MAG: hypothetical protein H7Z41_16280 [Cytophagales bacterium]|nr:hypothetical protein [Armatimonadota bacterium]
MIPLEPTVIARLPFGSPDLLESQGELRLFSDHTVQMAPSAATLTEFETFADGIQQKAVAWGSSLIVGLAAMGGILWLRGKRGGAWGAFGVSGAAGILSGIARRQAGQVTRSLIARHLLGKTATVTRSRSGGLTFLVQGAGLPPWSITLGPDDFEEAQAEAFLRAATISLVHGSEIYE